MLPLDDPRRFAEALERACDRVILDHYLLGDGSPQGQRTQQTKLPMLLETTGHARWTSLAVFDEVVGIFQEVFGTKERIGISRVGFNSVHASIREIHEGEP